MTDLLVADSTGLFPVVTCTLCPCLPTQHRCLASVTHGGVIFGTGTVCGIPVCSLCNASYNEEHVVRCHDHCKRATEDGSSDKENEQTAATRKPSSAKQAATLKQPKAADNSAKDLLVLAKQAATLKQPKAADYSAKDLLVLAQAYIRTSENAIEGTSQKKNKFWDDVAEAFKHLKVC
jgi:N-acetylmuramoyl-L-alanine amidase CwlA